MRRSALAAIAPAALLFALLPGSALATVSYVPGTFDQGVAGTVVDQELGWYTTDSTQLTQTITPSKTGLLTRVEMACQADGSVNVTLAVGTSTAQGVCSDGQLMTQFVFAAPMPTVVAGTQFTMSIDTGGEWVSFTYSVEVYAGGAAADGGEPIVMEGDPPVTLTSFAFLTYVLEPPTTTYTWNPTSVRAGVSTTATLTAVTRFPDVEDQGMDVVPGGAEPNEAVVYPMAYHVQLAGLPAWFSPTGIQCSAEVTNCSLANFSTGLTATGTGAALTVTVVVTGTAAPPAGSGGQSGHATGNGCNSWLAGEATIDTCGNAQGDLAVGVPPAVTPPPTTTGGTSGSTGGSAWPPAGVLGVLVLVLVFAAWKPARSKLR